MSSKPAGGGLRERDVRTGGILRGEVEDLGRGGRAGVVVRLLTARCSSCAWGTRAALRGFEFLEMLWQ